MAGAFPQSNGSISLKLTIIIPHLTDQELSIEEGSGSAASYILFLHTTRRPTKITIRGLSWRMMLSSAMETLAGRTYFGVCALYGVRQPALGPQPFCFPTDHQRLGGGRGIFRINSSIDPQGLTAKGH